MPYQFDTDSISEDIYVYLQANTVQRRRFMLIQLISAVSASTNMTDQQTPGRIS